MFVNKQFYGGKNISIFAPDFSFIGHSITNLAKFQAAYFESKNSLHLENNLNNKTHHEREVNFYHIGNSPHNLEVLDNFVKSRTAQNIVILHDTNLTDLIKYAVKNNSLKSLTKILKNQSPLLVRKVLQDSHPLDATMKCSFFIDSIIKANLRNTKIIIHNSNHLKFPGKFAGGTLNQIELPIGYHFMRPLAPNPTPPVPLIVIGGSHRDNNFSENIKLMIQELSLKRNFRVIILGGIAKHSLGTLSELPNVSILENVSNENWQVILSRADISIRIAVGRNGESSGFLRDSVLRSKYVLGDEDSQLLKNFSNYTLLNQDSNIKEIGQKIAELLKNNYPRDIDQISSKNLEFEQKSLTKYFDFLNDFVVNP